MEWCYFCCHRFLGDTQQNKIMAASVMEEAIEISDELSPCSICGRTFLPGPLQKHTRVCERNATKKRRIFDSLKQRIEGTDLAPFYQPSFLRRHETTTITAPSTTTITQLPVDHNAALRNAQLNAQRNQNKWKEKHEEFVKAIRAAKGAKEMGPRRSISAVGSMGTTERCPSCDRQFGPKSYERHVEWCRDQRSRAAPLSPAAEKAKERLEARTKYRVPLPTKSKRSLTREKYAASPSHATASTTSLTRTVSDTGSFGTVSASASVVSLGRSPSIRKPKQQRQQHQVHQAVAEAPVKIRTSPPPNEKAKNNREDYNPFVMAEKQLMDLLECDEFKAYNTTLISKPSTKSRSNTPLTDNNSKLKSAQKSPRAKRASVIDPPRDFQDKIINLQDNFEILENFINDNYIPKNPDTNSKNRQTVSCNNNKGGKSNGLSLNSILAERKYSDDMNTIDPNLINETDNLSIPDVLPIDNCSPVSSNNDLDHYSVQYDKNISVLEPQLVIKTGSVLKRSISSQGGQPLDDIDFEDFISSFEDDESFPTLKSFLQTSKIDRTQKRAAQKSTLSLNCSFGAATKTTAKTPLSPLKRSVSLSNPVVKARSMKNKQDIQDYLHVRENREVKTKARSPQRSVVSPQRNVVSPQRNVVSPQRNVVSPQRNAVSPQRNVVSPQRNAVSPKSNAEELFPPDHEMYEEYKKYEEMYQRERAEFLAAEPKGTADFEDEVSSNEDNQRVERKFPTGKFSGDSAYGSLNRKSPKVQPKAAKHPAKISPIQQRPPLERSPSSSGSETSGTTALNQQNQRLSKFCHECGTKYPLNTAKFCVECGIRRLVL